MPSLTHSMQSLQLLKESVVLSQSYLAAET